MVPAAQEDTLFSYDSEKGRATIRQAIKDSEPGGRLENRIRNADWHSCLEDSRNLTEDEKLAWIAQNILGVDKAQLNPFEARDLLYLVEFKQSQEYLKRFQSNESRYLPEAQSLSRKRAAVTQTADKISPVVGGPEKRPLDVVLKGFDRKQQEYLKTAVEEAKRIVFTVPNMDKQSLALAATNLDAIFLAPFSSKSVWQPQGTGPHLDASRPSQSQ